MTMEENWIDTCESEPLAHSGAIQPHGGLIFLDSRRTIAHVSANIDVFLPYSAEHMVGGAMPADLQEILTEMLDALPQAMGSRAELFGVDFPNRTAIDFVISRSHDGVVIEIFKHEHRLIRTPTSILPMKTPSNADELDALHNRVVQMVHEVTGFDRVMIYVFRDDGDGEVVAEARREVVYGSYLGLRFPASDIPLIARRLYKQNPWRLIPDSQAPSIALLSRETSPPDLTWSDLRSVSPVHQSYLFNMGVGASLSLPVMSGGHLWGLIACHHSQKKTIPLKLMRASSQIAKHYGLLVSTWVAETRMRFVDRLDGTYSSLRIALSREGGLISSMPEIAPPLFDLFNSSGIAIRVGSVWALTGDSPNASTMEMLSEWFESDDGEAVRLMDSMSRSISGFSMQPVAGALVLKLMTRDKKSLQLWLFRRELIYEVEWGGNPDKPVEIDQGRLGIAPRRSFDKWVEKRKDYSSPWSSENRLAAKRLHQLLIDLYA